MLHHRRGGGATLAPVNTDDVVKSGYLKKLKTMKKKFFVLRRETGPDSPARLEYYDNERKFRAGALPKKPIPLRSCFSINRKKDAKHQHVLTLFTNNDSVSMAADSEAELNDWLGFLHHQINQAMSGSDGQPQIMYEHTWDVDIQQRSLGSSKGLSGSHRICLTCRSVALMRVGDSEKKIEFPLNSIRRCGHMGAFFFLGLGRSAVTGAGDIWMLTEDHVIAENMHSIIRNAMHDPCNSVGEDTVQSRERTQSMSNNRNFDGGGSTGGCGVRERCGSMPSRSRTSSEGSMQSAPRHHHTPGCTHHHQGDGASGGSHGLHVARPKSMYSTSLSSPSCQPFALFSPSSSESMDSVASVDVLDGLDAGTPVNHTDNHHGLDEDNYIPMGGGDAAPSHPHHHFSLPISSTRQLGSAGSKGLVSPVSCGEGPCLSSPQDGYLEMSSPSEVAQAAHRRGYLNMATTCQSSLAPSNSSYMSMAPLNSPGSVLPSWPSHSSSQVSSPPHSANHSRMSSLVDDTDSYLSMVPGSLPLDPAVLDRSEGYLDMTPAVPTPIPYSPSEGDSIPEMSPGSSCSFTSGTPSSDHRFPDCIAEKSGSGSCYNCSEDDDSSLDRPIRTNSVGSKPEQFRSRKNSAPILGSSPISNSWSGTPGIFFRGFLQARSQERNDDLMEFDFSKNKSCDSISADKEKKSSSFESIKRTLTGQRHRSNSKSSGNGKSMLDSIKRDKKKSESELSNKSIDLTERNRYYEINPSPRRKTSDSYEGYLPMKPILSSSQSSSTSEYLDMSSLDSLNRPNPLSESGTLPGVQDGYVDMTQRKGLGPLPLTSVCSTSAPASCTSSLSARSRKISSTLNPLSSQDMDEYMSVDLRNTAESSSHSDEAEKNKKKEKKNTKRKSFKESTKRKKSEPISVVGRGGDSGSHETSKKGTSPLASLSTFLNRKCSTSGTTPPKTPLSPTGSPLPKSSRGTPSPMSSLTRSKSREDRDTRKESIAKDSLLGVISSGLGSSCIEEASREAEESGGVTVKPTTSNPTPSHTLPDTSEALTKQCTNSSSKRASGVYEAQLEGKPDDKQENTVAVRKISNVDQVTGGNDHGSYVNLTPNTEKSDRQRKLSNISAASDYMNISPVNTMKPGEREEYVNMFPGGRGDSSSLLAAPQPSQCDPSPTHEARSPGRSGDSTEEDLTVGPGGLKQQNCKDSQPSGSCSVEAGQGGGGQEGDYLLMTPGQPSPKPLSPQTVARRPNIPPALLTDRSDASLTTTLERLNLGNSGANSNERCRSHSGPGAPEGSAVGGDARVKKQLSEPRGGCGGPGGGGRAASACSSPVSYSPPTSPTLCGSVSSVSSLSEGGLSSASSTCTVVNVGLTRREAPQPAAVSRGQDPTGESAPAAPASSTDSQQLTGAGSGEGGLNYVALDLGPAKCEGVRPSPRLARRAAGAVPAPGQAVPEPVAADDGEPLTYAQIDFTKSEILRTTTLSHDHRP